MISLLSSGVCLGHRLGLVVRQDWASFYLGFLVSLMTYRLLVLLDDCGFFSTRYHGFEIGHKMAWGFTTIARINCCLFFPSFITNFTFC